MKDVTKTIKLSMQIIKKENIITEKDLTKELKDFQYKSRLAYNNVMTFMYNKDMNSMIYKLSKEEIDNVYKIESKKVVKNKFDAYCRRKMVEIIDGIYRENIDQALRFLKLKYEYEKKEGLLQGKKSLVNFKRNTPIILRNRNYKIIETPKGLGVEIQLFGTDKKKEYGMKEGKVRFLFYRINKSERAILRRMFDGSYKQGMAQIIYNNRKKKWELAMAYSFKKEENKELNPNLVMGIDVGIAKAVVFSILDVEKNEYKWLRYNECCIDGRELIHFRDKVEARRREIYKSCKWASKNNIGHGRKARTAKADEISDKIARFRDTYNHKISRYVVDMALKNNVGCIQLENLSGFTEHQKDKFLRQWAYYDLQNKITYKAEEAGIVVNKINPQYTSKRCNKCGCIDDRNRDCKKDQANFTCVVCGHKENADINASKNICIPNIEKIIEEQLKGIS